MLGRIARNSALEHERDDDVPSLVGLARRIRLPEFLDLRLRNHGLLAENAHPFEDPSLRMDNPLGLFGLTGSSLSG